MKRPFQSTQTNHDVESAEQSETTPWLQHTRWPELFRNRPLDIIAAAARQPKLLGGGSYLLGRYQGSPLWSSAETEAQLRIILQGLDLMFDRARATVDRTPYMSRCWLNTYSKDTFWPHGFRIIPSFKAYLAIWKRFICFVFRVLQYSSRQRREIFNLRPGSTEMKMMQYILYLVGQLQLERDEFHNGLVVANHEDGDKECQERRDDCGVDSDSYYDSDLEDLEADEDSDADTDREFDDNTESEEEEEEEEDAETDQKTGGDGSDFCLPSGHWLRLSEALFQLSMMFWTHQDPAGNMSSSVIIYFTAVMGIQQHSLAYSPAHSSTSGLAALVWVGRLLFLEYALPVYSYTTLAYIWPSRDRYLSQPDRLNVIRKKYLIRGCYTPFGEIVELKAFAKSIVKREGTPGNLSWDPDGQSLTIGRNRKFRLSEFCETHRKVIKLVQERVNEMMLGLEVDINADEIQDDLTCRKAGWSFVRDRKNELADSWTMLADKLRSSGFRGKPFVQGTDWQIDTCTAYLDAGLDLSKLTFAASHFSGGLPGRGTEMATIRWVNTTLAIRNIFFRGGQMMVIISYNKARASNNYAFYIVRYLPRELSLSLLKYLAIIRPLLGFIARQLKLPHWSDSEFFFPDPCGKKRHLSPIQASSIIRDLTRDLITPWTLSSYRQAALAIAKRYISKLVERSNFYCPTEATNPIRMFAAGAGHHPRMLLTAYAIDKALPSRLQPELLEMYYRLSTMWQDWNQQYDEQCTRSIEPETCSHDQDRIHANLNDLKRQSKKRKISSQSINNSTNGLTDGFVYNAEYRILICVSCGSMIQPGAKSFYSHLNSIHRITGLACKAFMERFQTYELCPFELLPLPEGKILQIPGLTVYEGWRCNVCLEVSRSSHFTVSVDKIRDHLAVHKLGLTPMTAEELQKFQPCYLQTFSSAKGRIKYFEIEPTVG